jgi:protocatechuate 3,4-dioxygenase alpha subunit
MSGAPLSPPAGGLDGHAATPSQTVGPFFLFALAPDERLGSLAATAVGERLHLHVRVLDGAGMPVADALVEIYQANAAGEYSTPEFSGFGRLATHADGRCVFETIRPGRDTDPQGRRQASHINVCVFARGLLRSLFTRVYFAGDPDVDVDPLLALVPAERRGTLLAAPAPGAAGSWAWDIHLQGERETVFFDL